MKKLLLLLLCVPLLFSCGEESLKDLDKNIENEEDAVEALITLTKAKIEILERFKAPMQDLSDLSKEMKKRGEDIKEAQEDLNEKIYDEDWDEEDLEDADNWDEFEDLVKELEELEEDMLELALDNDEDLSEISSYGIEFKISGVKADAEKMCDMMCDAQELMEKAQKDPTNTDLMGEAMKMTTDNASTMAEMEEKYKDDPEGKKALAEAVLACKCD